MTQEQLMAYAFLVGGVFAIIYQVKSWIIDYKQIREDQKKIENMYQTLEKSERHLIKWMEENNRIKSSQEKLKRMENYAKNKQNYVEKLDKVNKK